MMCADRMNAVAKKIQRGFTLIELVIVIVIIAILAAFALPRFADLATNARKSATQGMNGSVLAAANLAHSVAIANNNTASQSVTMLGQTVTMVNYYPAATAAGIQAAIQDTSGFTIDVGPPVLFQVTGAPTLATCSVSYTAAAANAAPTVTPTVTGC